MDCVKRMNICQKVLYDECLKVTWKTTYTAEMGGVPERSCEARAPLGNTTSGGRQVALVAVRDREGQVNVHVSQRRRTN